MSAAQPRVEPSLLERWLSQGAQHQGSRAPSVCRRAPHPDTRVPPEDKQSSGPLGFATPDRDASV